MSVTIKDVAKMAGVSISTVSRVINDSKPVSPEVRRKVLKAIEELNYKPNEVARSLVTKKSNLIGVVVDDIGHSYVAQILRGIEEVGKMYNYDILLCSTYGNPKAEIKFVQLLMRKQVEGLILVSEILNIEAIEQINNYKIPFVHLNKYYNVDKSPTVTIDNYKASRIMTEYLIELGHKNIIYLTNKKDLDMTVEKDKIKGYKDSMDSIKGKYHIVEVEGYNIDHGYSIGEEIIRYKEKEDITAVFCCKDEIAIGLINYLYDNGMNVPGDISIAGYGDIKLGSIYRPKLTTVREPNYDIGAVAIRRLLKELNKEEIIDQTIKLPIQLIQRESCKEIL